MKITKNGLYVIGGIAIYIGLFVATSLAVLQYMAYQQEVKLQNAKTQIQQSLKNYNYDMQTTGGTSKSLEQLAATIKNETINTSAKNQNKFEAKSALLQQAITNLATASVYSTHIGDLLVGQQYGGKFTSAEDTANLAKKWQRFNTELQSIKPLSGLQKQHEVLTASSANQVIIATNASQAFKDGDATTIAAQTKNANAETAKIQAVYDDIYAFVRAQQTDIVQITRTL